MYIMCFENNLPKPPYSPHSSPSYPLLLQSLLFSRQLGFYSHVICTCVVLVTLFVCGGWSENNFEELVLSLYLVIPWSELTSSVWWQLSFHNKPSSQPQHMLFYVFINSRTHKSRKMWNVRYLSFWDHLSNWKCSTPKSPGWWELELLVDMWISALGCCGGTWR